MFFTRVMMIFLLLIIDSLAEKLTGVSDMFNVTNNDGNDKLNQVKN